MIRKLTFIDCFEGWGGGDWGRGSEYSKGGGGLVVFLSKLKNKDKIPFGNM